MSESGGHEHVCARCDHLWNCQLLLDKKGLCLVDRAAKVNKGGPFCELCRYLIMAKRLARQRQLTMPGLLALLGDVTDVE